MLWLMVSGGFAYSSNTGGLFEKMAGSWMGDGERVQLISGRRIRIEARTVAIIEGHRLVSHNEIAEIPETGSVRRYIRDYWIQPSTLTFGAFELGQKDQVTSQGRFDGRTLEVEQQLGGNPAYVIRSHTQLETQESLYQETAWHGEQQIAHTSIRYRRL